MPEFLELASPLIVLCSTDGASAAGRHLRRGLENPDREFYHGDERVARYRETGEVSPPGSYTAPDFDVPTIRVSTDGEYVPCIDEIVRQIKSSDARQGGAPATSGVRRNPDRLSQMHEEEYIGVRNFSDSLSICVTAGPSFDGSQGRPSTRCLGLTFDSDDKEALFFRALKVFNPAAAVAGRIPVEDFRRGKWDDLMSQFERSVEQATVSLPMLRRLKEEYEDAAFSPDEVGVLREECLKVRARTDDFRAVSSLEKLIHACDEALKERSGLLFASD